jgi:hypothetical protein
MACIDTISLARNTQNGVVVHLDSLGLVFAHIQKRLP